jgi:hypothetical protein
MVVDDDGELLTVRPVGVGYYDFKGPLFPVPSERRRCPDLNFRTTARQPSR